MEYGGLKPILPFLGGRSDAARRVVILLAAVPSPYQPLTIPLPSPYHRRTCVAAPSDFTAKSEGALEEVRRWYGEGAVEASRNKTSAQPTQTMQIDACSGVACRIAIKGCVSRLMVAAARLMVPRRLRGFRRDSFQDAGGIWITTRRAASLRPPRNGGIGFKPPYSPLRHPPDP